jgi:hypothetical protein
MRRGWRILVYNIELFEDKICLNASHMNSVNRICFNALHLNSLKTGPNSMHCIQFLWRQDLIQCIASEFFEYRTYSMHSLKTGPNSMYCIRILWRQDIIQCIASELFDDRAYFKASHLNSMNMGPASLHLICILWEQDLFHYNASDFCTRFYQVTVVAKNSTLEFFMRFVFSPALLYVYFDTP